ncbi:MAG: hypothetical protein HWE24_18060 [Oceanospirillaceae bacterium]|nr:hypothetical protein [Oceanospirillaceae bacterium]
MKRKKKRENCIRRKKAARTSLEGNKVEALKSTINLKINNDQLSRPKGESAIDFIVKLESMGKEKSFTKSAKLKISNRYAQLAASVGCSDKNKAMSYIVSGKK